MRSDDIQLEAPLVRSPETVPAAEDRSYVGFIASALLIAILGGFVLATVLPLVQSGTLPGVERVPRLIQTHGWAQLQGWAGLFVAGMGVRLIPRFAGRRPVPRRITMPILALLVVSVVVRTIAEPFIDGQVGTVAIIAAGLAGAAGTAAIAAVLAVNLARGRRKGEAWECFAWAGTAWWAAWALYILVAAWRASDNEGMTPVVFDDALTWIVILGAISNFIWCVQSRSVPVFFGRSMPRVRNVFLPGIALNAGTLLVAASLWPPLDDNRERLSGIGLALAGAGIATLAPQAGSLWGTATRLRPRARSASRFVLAANWWALTGGVLLLYAGAQSAWSGNFESFGARDAARHALGTGLITMLIFGMARLVAPVFAMSRAEARPAGLLERLPLWLLLGATALRVATGLAYGHGDSDVRLRLASVAGALAWLGLVCFALSVIRAVRDEPRMRAVIADAAAQARATTR